MSPEALSNIRKDYTLHSLNEDEVAESPIAQFSKWWEEAAASSIEEMNAMTVATADSKGMPDARIVLFKAFD